jgi:hypothetical protein
MVVFGRKRIIVKPQNGWSITCKMNWILRGIGRRDVSVSRYQCGRSLLLGEISRFSDSASNKKRAALEKLFTIFYNAG